MAEDGQAKHRPLFFSNFMFVLFFMSACQIGCAMTVQSRNRNYLSGGGVSECQTVVAWKDHIEQAAKENKLVAVEFVASWAALCRGMEAVFERFSWKYPSMMFLKVDIDTLKDIPSSYEISAIPTLLVLKDGIPLGSCVGAHPLEWKELLDKHTYGIAAA